MSDSDFVELLWENGHIVMQGQSSRAKKSPLSSAFPSHSSRILDRDSGDGVTPRIARSGAVMGSLGGDIAPSMMPGTVVLNAQEDDMAPWLNYPMDDYYDEFLSEFSGANVNSFPGHGSTLTPMDKGAATGTFGLSHVGVDVEPHVPRMPTLTNVSDTGRVRTGQANQTPQQWQNSMQNSKPRLLDFGGAGSGTVSGQNISWELPNAKDQRQDASSLRPPPMPPTPSTSTSMINFSHFSRAASLRKANLQNANRLRNMNKVSTATSNPVDSTLIDTHSGMKSTNQEHLGSTSCMAVLRSASQPSPELASGTSRPEAVNWKDNSGIGNDNSGNISDKRLPDKMHVHKVGLVSMPVPCHIGKHGAEKEPKSVVAPSSVCSGNGGAAESGNPIYKEKRKATEEESGYQSEDIYDESIGAKKQSATQVTTSKRSRAAEVHNQSERRRRDRINEKMRALQELIPNCNKADKASMLDEAIEYLKTLQLQVQIMSMGSGFCMPPMMLPPAAMHRMRPPHMAHFPPMGLGVGMGMGIGYGMGMLNMNGNPLIPLPPISNLQFPCSSLGTASGLQSMPTTTTGLPMFGIPSQGVPVPMHRAPPFVPLTAHSAWPSGPPELPAVVDPASSKDQHKQNIGSEPSRRRGDPRAPISSQTMMKFSEHSSPVLTNDQASNSEEFANSSSGNGNSSSGASYD